MKDVPSWRTKEVVKAVRNEKLSELYDVAMPASCRRVTKVWSSVAERVISGIGIAFCHLVISDSGIAKTRYT